MTDSQPGPPDETHRNAGDRQPLAGYGIGLGEATRVWGLVALNSFGGPAGQIAVMHRFLVDERRWFSEKRFLHALNYCMLLPGPEAQQWPRSGQRTCSQDAEGCGCCDALSLGACRSAGTRWG